VVDENKIDEDEAVRGCLNVEALFRFLNARGFTMRPSPILLLVLRAPEIRMRKLFSEAVV
jgi:hypothetical protein